MRGRFMNVTLRVVGSALFALTAASGAQAQNYPTRLVHVIAPYGPGGPSDVFSRIVAQKLSEALKQSFVIENRPGASTMIGTDAVAKAPPDGYTLLVISQTHATNESLVANKPFQLLRDFAPVAPIYSGDLMMVVHKSVPAKTLAEFIALAKSKPGQLNYASSGTGTPYHMAGELFKAMAGVNIVHVPYKGSSGARTDVMGGQVQMMFDAIPTMAPSVEAGKVRALGTSGKVRSSVLPDVPTLSEAGVPGYEAVIWLGIMAPAGTPRPIVDKLNAEIRRIVSAPEMKDLWARQGAVSMTMTTDEFARYLREDIEKWARIVKISGAKPDA